NAGGRIIEPYGVHRSGTQPFSELHMRIDKRYTASRVMVASGDVLPTVSTWIAKQITIVDGIGMLVHEQQSFGRLGNAGLFEVLDVLRKGPVEASGGRIGATAESAEKRVHGDATYTGDPARGTLRRAEVGIRGALISANCAFEVASECAF